MSKRKRNPIHMVTVPAEIAKLAYERAMPLMITSLSLDPDRGFKHGVLAVYRQGAEDMAQAMLSMFDHGAPESDYWGA